MSEEIKNYIENTDFNKYKLVVDREYKEQYIQGLEQENQRLKEDYKRMKENFDSKVEVITTYKEVIEEVRKHTEENLSFCENDSQGAYDVCNIRMASDKKLLQILDKVKEQ